MTNNLNKADVKHTPGPWEISFEGAHRKTVRIRHGYGTAIATVHARVDRDANAHLIAAAPTLLEALESAPIIGPFESGQDFKKRQDVWLREVCLPAIALAKGEKVDG